MYEYDEAFFRQRWLGPEGVTLTKLNAPCVPCLCCVHVCVCVRGCSQDLGNSSLLGSPKGNTLVPEPPYPH